MNYIANRTFLLPLWRETLASLQRRYPYTVCHSTYIFRQCRTVVRQAIGAIDENAQQISDALYNKANNEPREYYGRQELAPDWDALPPGGASVEFGAAFLRSGRALGLIVPSAVMPEARNVILNPLHRRFADVEIAIECRFSFDPRLRLP